ncbi:Myeloperoxidase, thyroid peroxidase, cyclooxygenase catalytic domain protein [Minicystis rosea]|nr:Myeloperoxidase, thyroid peroxidase, cyclooxygenase catalytic domain protein [Minicystis rosea]
MSRILHGGNGSLEQVQEVIHSVQTVALKLPVARALVPPIRLRKFDYMFPGLQASPANLLPTSQHTLEGLDALGLAMRESGAAATDPALDSKIPSAYTYLGQFIDHDITLELRSDTLADVTAPNLAPLALADIQTKLFDARTLGLDLDSVYDAPAPRDDDKMVVGRVSTSGGPVPGVVDPFHDLPRSPRATDPKTDREALIGDARNDENLVVAQLHTAFLRAHNAIVDQGHTFTEARRLLRQHYQWIVLHDFLPRIANPRIVSLVVRQHTAPQRPTSMNFMPLEFAAAAYRFGHSMVRASYDHNVNFPNANLGLLFTFTALSGNFNPAAGIDFDTLPENWIIQWERFLDNGAPPANFARRIDTRLVEPLYELRDLIGKPLPGLAASLAARNLRRGYMLRLPTGQAAAHALGLSPLTPAQLHAAATPAQAAVLQKFGFEKATPLWFYVLAEANLQTPNRLGPVGSSIVARVFANLVRQSADSILATPGWTPTLGPKPGVFRLNDLLELANVL